jgi:predicted GNAT family acetyltransferase
MTDLPAVLHDSGRHRFHLQLEGHEAELDYHLQDGRMVIDHTGVPQAIGGRGVAARLMQAAFDHARAQDWRVVPACSYARVWLERNPGYADLLAD